MRTGRWVGIATTVLLSACGLQGGPRPVTGATGSPGQAPVTSPDRPPVVIPGSPAKTPPATSPVTSPGAPGPAPTAPAVPVANPATPTSRFGPDPAYAPSGDVTVPVGSLSQSLLDSHPAGTRFVLAPGIHRLTAALRPGAQQQLLGQPGAVISGAVQLGGWQKSGNSWYVGNQHQRLTSTNGQTDPASPNARIAERVYVDDRELTPVASFGDLGPGKSFFDTSSDRLYMGDDPTGHVVETPVALQAFNGGGGSVTIRNLVVEKFGCPAQTGAISNGTQSGWTVQDCEVRYNHGVGVFVGQGGAVRGCWVHHQGQLGLAGNGSNNVVEHNEISYNNTAGYDTGWEAGGSKWANTTALTVRDNWSHDNYGPGLWTDIDNRGTRYEANLVEHNLRQGILHEISYDATMVNNVVRNNGTTWHVWEVDGAGIVLSNSQGVEISGNNIEGNQTGVVLLEGPRGSSYLTRNNSVHDNTVAMTQGYTGVIQVSQSSDALYASQNNHFDHNSYRVPSASGKWWNWQGSSRTWSEWQGYGQDPAGTVQVE